MNIKASSLTDKQLPEKVMQLFNHVLEENPLHKSFLVAALRHLKLEEISHLGEYIEYCETKGHDVRYLTESYLTIVEDTFREQIYFQTHQVYRNSSFSAVANDIYFNNEYMAKYMYGLAITTFLWPNHVTMARFFKKAFPKNKRGKYLEIGPGHGYHIMTATQIGVFDEYIGIDISDACIDQTRDIVEYFHPSESGRLRLEVKDFLSAKDLEPSSFDAIVMGEVLEHVENPDMFLSRISELAKPDAYIYVTTCINTPAIDHIFNWSDIDAVEDMLRENGLKIEEPLRLTHNGKSLEESISERLAISVAYVLSKA